MAESHSKACTKCGETKPITEFRQRVDRPSRKPYCIACVRADNRNAWARRQAEVVAARPPARPKPPKGTTRRKVAPRRDPAYLEWRRQWREANRDKVNARSRQVRGRIKQSQPAWADDVYIRQLYRFVKVLRRETGLSYEVDHIVPTLGKTVCGLHVESNLRIVHEFENKSKGNRLWPDMP